jgi:rod shape-determining protein MreD
VIVSGQSGETCRHQRRISPNEDRRRVFWGSATFSKILSAAIILLMLVVFQSLLSDLVTIGGIRLDLAVVILVYVALTRGPAYGMTFGFAIGLLLDVFTPSTLGWGALVKCLIGFTVGSFKDNLYLESLYSKGAVMFLALIANDLLYYLFVTGLTATTGDMLLRASLPSAVYTSAVGMLIFLAMNRIHWEKWSVEKSSG